MPQSTLRTEMASRPHDRRRERRNSSRRRGVAVIYMALSLGSFLGVSALVVDLGSLYTRRTQAQRAADAAALAGVYELGEDGSPSKAPDAVRVAKAYAKLNGYDDAKGEVKFVRTGAGDLPSGVPANSLNRVAVQVQREEPLYFLPMFAAVLNVDKKYESVTTSKVGATAVAEIGIVTPPVDISITGGTPFGSTQGAVNPAIFGPYAPYTFGDSYSTYYLPDGSENTNPNPNSNNQRGKKFGGYNYKIKIPQDQVGKPLQLEIFDPDSYSTNGVDGWDEQRQAFKTDENYTSDNTKTRFELRKPNGDLIATATYGGGPGDLDDDRDGVPDSDLKWTTPDGFTFTPSVEGEYNLNIKTIDGASENGFQLRIGEAHNDPALRDPANEADWINVYDKGGRANGGKGNGLNITATGKAPMNFTRDGDVDIALGNVPGDAAGGKVFVTKYDTDIGAQSIRYRYQPENGSVYDHPTPGQVPNPGNGVTTTDALDVPDTYPGAGATWFARYVASKSDTSVWEMSFGHKVPPGTVHLVE